MLHSPTLPGKHWATIAHRFGRDALTAAIVALSACGKDSTSAPKQAGPPAKVVLVSGEGQIGIVAQELAAPLVVRVVDADGMPVPGQAVNFHVTAGGGSVFAGTSNTNADGIVKERWTLGTSAGADQTIEARAVDNTTGAAIVFATFHATAKPAAPSQLAAIGPTSISGTVSTPLRPLPQVVVRDQYGNPAPDVVVNFAVSSGGGTIAPSSATTNSNGTAALSSWALPTKAGTYSVTASASAVSGASVTFSALAKAAAPASIARTDQGDLGGQVGTALSPITFRVADTFGNPVAGARITFTVSAAGGALTSGNESGTTVSTNSDLNGAVTVIWTLGTIAGSEQKLDARVIDSGSGETLVSTSLYATAVAGAAAYPVLATNPPLKTVVDVLMSPQPVVRLVDKFGNPVAQSGVYVHAIVLSGTNQLRGTSTVQTDNNGLAAFTDLSLGGPPGSIVLDFRASGVGGAAPASIYVSPGPPASMAAASQTTLLATSPGVAVSPVPTVRVSDAEGWPVPGVTVTFSGPGQISPQSVLTDATGIAAVSKWVLPNSPGTYTLTAAVSGLVGSPISFVVTAQ